MAADGTVEALAAVGLFRGCNKRELRAIARLSTPLRVDEGFVLTSQGGPGVECLVIADGDAKVVIDGRTVAKVGPGDCVGEMALLDGGRRTATVVAQTAMTLYVLSVTEFRALIDTSTTIDRKIMANLARRLREAEA